MGDQAFVHHAGGGGEGQPEVLSAAGGRFDASADETGRQIVAARQVPAHSTGVADLDGGHGATHDPALQAVTNGLDLG
jgi:hypothetical protein